MIKFRYQMLVYGILSFLVYKARSFRLTNLTVPPLQDPRKDMIMLCQFDMGKEDLYSVKWYKDDHEFFRYTPSIKSLYTIFPVEGVYVDTKRSRCDTGRCDLVLFNLTRFGSSGQYRCEVSSEAPSFRLVSRTENVTVAVIPEEYPVIKSLQNSYYINDILFATCTSGAGDPRPTLNFFLNKQPVPPSGTKTLYSDLEVIDSTKRIKLQKSSIQLRVVLDKKLVGNETTMEVVCVSSVEATSHPNYTTVSNYTCLPKGINQKLYTPLATTRSIVILDPNQSVKNQKFYWPTSSASTTPIMSILRYFYIFSNLFFVQALYLAMMRFDFY